MNRSQTKPAVLLTKANIRRLRNRALFASRANRVSRSLLRKLALAFSAALLAGLIVTLAVQFGAPIVQEKSPENIQLGQFAVVKREAVFKSKPDADSPVLGFLRENARVKIIECAPHNWYKVRIIDLWDKRTANVEEGYIHGDLLSTKGKLF